jgi:apolipoprotein N-acyltransferase
MRLVPKGLLRNHVAEWVTNQIIGVVIALFVVGSIFVTAIVWVSNATKYAGANAAVITICTVLIPTMGGLACFSKVLVLFGFV